MDVPLGMAFVGFPDFQKISFCDLHFCIFWRCNCFYNWEDNLMIKIMFNLFSGILFGIGLAVSACLIPLKSNHFLIFWIMGPISCICYAWSDYDNHCRISIYF